MPAVLLFFDVKKNTADQRIATFLLRGFLISVFCYRSRNREKIRRNEKQEVSYLTVKSEFDQVAMCCD